MMQRPSSLDLPVLQNLLPSHSLLSNSVRYCLPHQFWLNLYNHPPPPSNFSCLLPSKPLSLASQNGSRFLRTRVTHALYMCWFNSICPEASALFADSQSNRTLVRPSRPTRGNISRQLISHSPCVCNSADYSSPSFPALPHTPSPPPPPPSPTLSTANIAFTTLVPCPQYQQLPQSDRTVTKNEYNVYFHGFI